MSDRRRCACGTWPITEYGRWGPCCMGELESLKLGDKLLFNARVDAWEVVREVEYDNEGEVHLVPMAAGAIVERGHQHHGGAIVNHPLNIREGKISHGWRGKKDDIIWTFYIERSTGANLID